MQVELVWGCDLMLRSTTATHARSALTSNVLRAGRLVVRSAKLKPAKGISKAHAASLDTGACALEEKGKGVNWKAR